MDDFSKELIRETVSQSTGSVYTDLLQPTTRAIGNTLSFLPRTVGVWLGKWEKWIINGEKSIELTKQVLQEKLNSIPEEKLSEPAPNIAIPAIQQLSYCYDSEDLRRMYANLLVTSMNLDTKNKAHPSYVDIIKQLTPDEAKILKNLSFGINQLYPLISIKKAMIGKNMRSLLISNYTDVGLEFCEYPNNISTYIENFERLGLILINKDEYITDTSMYDKIKKQSYIQNIISKPLPNGQEYLIEEYFFSITNFGLSFIKSCVIDFPIEESIT